MMKSKYVEAMTMPALLALAIVNMPMARADNEKNDDAAVSWARTPPAVQKTVAEHAAPAEIGRIVRGDEDGQMVYEVKLTKGDRGSELTIAANGKLLSLEEQAPWSEVPDAVRQTIHHQAGQGKVETVEKVTEKGETFYEAKITTGGKRLELTIASDGKIKCSEDVTGKQD